MSITPNHCHRVVTFFHHVSGIYVLGNFLYLQNLSAVNFIDAARALALSAQFKRIDALFRLAVGSDNNPGSDWIIDNFSFVGFHRLNFLVNFLGNLVI